MVNEIDQTDFLDDQDSKISFVRINIVFGTYISFKFFVPI